MMKITLCAACAATALFLTGCAAPSSNTSQASLQQDYTGAPAANSLGGTLTGHDQASAPQPDYYTILSDPGRF